MIFAPQTSIVRKICGQTLTWILRYPITPVMWSAELQKLEGHTSSVRAVAFSADGSLLASTSDDRTVRLWNPSTGQEVQKLAGHTDWVRAVAFSADGSLLASASADQTVRLWNPSTGQEVQKFKDELFITTIKFTVENKTLLTNRGALSIDDRLLPGQAIEPLTNETIVIKNEWIRRGERNLLWLPQEYRSGCSAFSGNTIAIGLNSGQVRFIQLNS